MEEEEIKEETKVVDIIIPTSLDHLSIEKVTLFNKLIKDSEGSTEGNEALGVKILSIMVDIDEDVLKLAPYGQVKLANNAVLELVNSIATADYKMEDYRVITIDGVEYGLEPNFDNIETGAYIDLADLISSPAENLSSIMSILYRPVKERFGELYSITPYSTEEDEKVKERAELFYKKMNYAVTTAMVGFMEILILKHQPDIQNHW